MRVIIRDLTEKTLDDHPCFKFGNEETVSMTKDWLRKVYQKFGPCVKAAYVDGNPVAMVQYAPMDIFPHVDKPDAHQTIVIHCIYIADETHKGKGIGRKLTESLIHDLKKPHPYLSGGRFKRIVALAGKNRAGPAAPLGFFLKMGFTAAERIREEDVLVQLQLYEENR